MSRVRVTYKIEQELDRKVKLKSAQSVFDGEKITQSDIVEAALEMYFKKNDSKDRG